MRRKEVRPRPLNAPTRPNPRERSNIQAGLMTCAQPESVPPRPRRHSAACIVVWALLSGVLSGCKDCQPGLISMERPCHCREHAAECSCELPPRVMSSFQVGIVRIEWLLENLDSLQQARSDYEARWDKIRRTVDRPAPLLQQEADREWETILQDALDLIGPAVAAEAQSQNLQFVVDSRSYGYRLSNLRQGGLPLLLWAGPRLDISEGVARRLNEETARRKK